MSTKVESFFSKTYKKNSQNFGTFLKNNSEIKTLRFCLASSGFWHTFVATCQKLSTSPKTGSNSIFVRLYHAILPLMSVATTALHRWATPFKRLMKHSSTLINNQTSCKRLHLARQPLAPLNGTCTKAR